MPVRHHRRRQSGTIFNEETETTIAETTAETTTADIGRVVKISKGKKNDTSAVAVLDFSLDFSEEKETTEGGKEEEDTLASPEEFQAAITRLIAEGVNRSDAKRLATNDLPECLRQLEYLSFISEFKSSRGAYLRTAIEQGYGPPPRYEQKQEVERKQQEKQQQVEREKASNSTLEAQRAALDAETDTELIRLEKDAPETFSAFLVFVEKQKKLQRKPGMTQAILRRLNDAFESPATRRKLYQEWRLGNSANSKI